MYITLYFIVTRLPDSLRAVRDHFLALDPTDQEMTPFPTVEPFVRPIIFCRISSSPSPPHCPQMLQHVTKSGGGGGSGGSGSGGSRVGAVQRGGSGSGQGEVVAVARGNSSSIGARPLLPSSFMSGLLSVGRLGVVFAARMSFGRVTVLVRHAGQLLRSGVDIFALDYDAILAAMYALSVSAEGDCYLCVPPDLGVEAAALGASESALPGKVPAEALHTFTLDSGDSRSFFRDSTTLTPHSAPIPARLADPLGGPFLARSCTVLPCLAVPSNSLSGLHLPSFSTNLVSTAALQDAVVTTTTLRGLCLPSRPRLPRPTFLASRGGSAPLLTPPRFLRRLLPCRLSTWACGPSPFRLLLRELFREDLPVQRLHYDRGGEFSSDLLRDFCRGEGILLLFTLPASPQKNGVAEHHIGLVMEVARTSMIHAAAPHFLWPFASVFRVWGSRAFVRDTSADKPFSRTILCVFLGFPPDASGWQFYHPTSRRVLPSQDVTFDKSVPFYCLFPFRSAPLPPPPLFLAPCPPPVDPLPPKGPAPSGVSQVDPLPGIVLVKVAIDSDVARDTASGGAASGGAEPASAEPVGAEPAGAEPGGAELKGAERGGPEPEVTEPGGADPWSTTSSGGPAGASPRLSPRPEPLSLQLLREWFAQITRLWSGADGAGDSAAGGTGAGGARATSLGDAGATSLGGARFPAGAGGTGGAVAVGPGGARTRETGAAGAGGVGGAGAGGAGAGDPGAGGAGAGGAGAGDPGARGAGAGGTGAGRAGAGGTKAVDPGARAAGVGGAGAGGTGAGGTMQRLQSPPPCQSQPQLQTDSFTERHELESRLASPVRAVRTSRRVPRPRPPPVPGTHVMALRPSSIPLRVPLPPPPESSLPTIPDPDSDLAHAASPTVSRLLATVGGECALGTDVLEDRQEDFECLAAASGGLTERRELASRPVSPIRTARRVPRSRPPPVPGTHAMTLRPSFVPLRVPLPAPRESSLPEVPDQESDRARAASPTISCLLATAVTDPSFESAAASALVFELLDFSATCRLDYATALVAKSASTSPPSVGSECALGTDVLEDRQEDFECLAAAVPHLTSMPLAPEGDPDAPDIPTPRSYAEAITGPYSSQWPAAMDAEMAS
ncbi:unnamed protein product [Closterium sp. NIES-54]